MHAHRYSHLPSDQQAPGSFTQATAAAATLRALVLPMQPPSSAPAKASQAGNGGAGGGGGGGVVVVGRWQCEGQGVLGRLDGTLPLQPSATQPW